MTKTNDQKNQVIREKLGFKPPYIAICEHPESAEDFICSVNFFHPDIKERRNAQAILAGALLEEENAFIHHSFICWLEYTYRKEIKYISWTKIIAETKLAELFYEFMESEEKRNE